MAEGDYAVVIGVHDYVHLRRLDGVLADAEKVRDWLLSTGEVPAGNLRFVVADDRPGQPVTAAIHQAFNEIVSAATERTGPARRLYVYFAGHGLSRDLNRLMLLAADLQQNFMGKAIDSRRFQDAFANAPLFPEQVFWYDCCRDYDHVVTGQGPEWTWGDTVRPPSDLRQLVLYGTGFNDKANERSILGPQRGLFTVALLEALSGAAASPARDTHTVLAGDLVTYVRWRVDQLAQEFGLSQIPQAHTCGDMQRFVLVDSVVPVEQRIEVEVGDWTGHLRVRDVNLRELARHEIAAGSEVVVLHLPPGTYELRLAPHGVGRVVQVRPSPAAERVELVPA